MTDEYIKREAALNASKIVYIEYIEVDNEGYEDGNADVIPVVFKKDIEAIPAADVVEVVRCKDCKYGVPTKNGFLDDMIVCENKDSPCGYSSWLCQLDWYCADGEPKGKND